MSDGAAERRVHVRLPARIPMDWVELEPGAAGQQVTHRTVTHDVGASGLAFLHGASLGVGTYLRITLNPEGAEPGPTTEAVVAESHAATDAEAGYLIGVRYAGASDSPLHGVLLQAYEDLGEYSCLCLSIRHCGEVRERCPAALTNRNCWQIEDPPCCHWLERRDCLTCPVTLLAFLQ